MASTELSALELAHEAVLFLNSRLPEGLQNPKVAVVCGSGLSGLADTVQAGPRMEFDYASIPHFPRPTVAGHAGKLVFGLLGQKIPAVFMVGRAHYYEGNSMDQVTFPIRVFKLLGVDTVVLTNAAGGLNQDFNHIFLAGLAGMHPLRGPNIDDFGVRFPPLSDAYDLDLRRHVHQTWKEITPSQPTRKLHEGVYAFVGGPTYETRAESRMLRMLGADVVGMSTVPEIVVARHCGIRVLAFTLVTNCAVLAPVPRGDEQLLQGKDASELNAMLGEGKATHEEVLEAGRTAALDMQVRSPLAYSDQKIRS
ncbi:purine nucleoside phosphorylase [Penicillium longicatenatum]|nr:purine nucleoside phosphorylase [Penicillium longicatenatum]